MHRKSRKRVSVFSGVATLYQVFGNRWFRYSFHNLSLFLVVLSAFLTWLFLTPQTQLKLNVADIRKGELYLVILTANAVLVVIVTSLRYFYKDTLLKFDNVTEIVTTIRDFVMGLPNVASSDEKAKQAAEDFIENSREDFEFLQNPNASLEMFSSRAHIVSTILIFSSTAWAVLDAPFNAIAFDPSVPGVWAQHRIVIGYFLVALSFTTITLHGAIYFLLLLLRKYVGWSLREKNVIRNFNKAEDEPTAFEVTPILKKLEGKF